MIKLTDEQAQLYRSYLHSWRKISGQDDTYRERTEAFFASRTGRLPYWM